MSQFEDAGRDDPLQPVRGRSDEELFGTSPDAARMAPDGAQLDATGLAELMGVMTTVFQVWTAAKLSGFSDGQAFQLARDHYAMVMHMIIEQAREL